MTFIKFTSIAFSNETKKISHGYIRWLIRIGTRFRIRVIRLLTTPPIWPGRTILHVVMVMMPVVMICWLLLDVAKHPAEDVTSFVEQQPEGECVYQFEDEDLLDDQVHEVYWKGKRMTL